MKWGLDLAWGGIKKYDNIYDLFHQILQQTFGYDVIGGVML